MNKTFALVGNPNSGKTTLFNYLTGSNQHVGNWPGVTVQKKQGKIKSTNHNIVDLPGIYSLSPYSSEEIITRNFIVDENPDIIINIIDANNIQRNLYLTLQLIELQKPLIVVVNMIDELEKKNIIIDYKKLSELIGAPVIPISAKKGSNIKNILDLAQEMIDSKYINNTSIAYDNSTLNLISQIIEIITPSIKLEKFPHIFLATKIIEGDKQILDLLKLTTEQLKKLELAFIEYQRYQTDSDKDTMFADARYKFIENITNKSQIRNQDGSFEKDRYIDNSISNKIDKFLTNKYMGIPIFLIIMYIMFTITFGEFGSYLQDSLDYLFNSVFAPYIENLLIISNSPDWTISLLIDGIIGSVGGIITFVPQISLLFLFISILEDTGYIARAAFIMDRLLKKIGLSGKSFIPMLMGFGCTTTAVMATRTLENEDDRRLTIMVTPFMSCSARFVIYFLFAEVFFDKYKNIVVLSMYILGILIAILSAYILKKTLFKNSSSQFILELPPYRLPDIKSVILNVWDKSKGFIIRAGTVIFAMSIIIWFLQNFDFQLNMVDNSSSILAAIGALISPIFIPLGFGTWQSSVSLLTGFIAKESVVATMMVIYSANSNEQLSAAIQSSFNPLSAYSFMVFSLLYIPCISAFITMKKEMNSLKWAMGTALLQTGSAYIIALAIYQIGSLFYK